MQKQKTSPNIIWFFVVGILLLALATSAILLFTNLFSSSVTETAVQTTLSPEEKMTQEVLYNPTPPADAVFKPADKIIIKTVNFDPSGNITEVQMSAPAIMVDASMTIDGTRVEIDRSQQGSEFVLGFFVPDELLKKNVTFLLEKDGNQIATCSLVNGDTLVVSGDCVF